MFERFTRRGRQVVVLAEDEARALGHEQIGSEHLLLGLLRVDDGLVDVLGEPSDVRDAVVELVGLGEASPETIPFSTNATSVLRVVGDESPGPVGPVQIAIVLLSLPGFAHAKAIAVLRARGLDLAIVRERIVAPSNDQPGMLDAVARRVLDTAARHAEDVPVAPEHLLLALVLEVPDLTWQVLGLADGRVVQERLAGLLDGPEGRPAPRDIAVLEAALRCAERDGSDPVSPVHLLLGLLEVAPDVVARATVDLAAAATAARLWRRPP